MLFFHDLLKSSAPKRGFKPKNCSMSCLCAQRLMTCEIDDTWRGFTRVCVCVCVCVCCVCVCAWAWLVVLQGVVSAYGGTD